MQNKSKSRERKSEAVQGLWEGLKAILLRVAWQQGQSSPVGDHPRSPDIIHKWPTFVTVDFLLVFCNSLKRVKFLLVFLALYLLFLSLTKVWKLYSTSRVINRGYQWFWPYSTLTIKFVIGLLHKTYKRHMATEPEYE